MSFKQCHIFLFQASLAHKPQMDFFHGKPNYDFIQSIFQKTEMSLRHPETELKIKHVTQSIFTGGIPSISIKSVIKTASHA